MDPVEQHISTSEQTTQIPTINTSLKRKIRLILTVIILMILFGGLMYILGANSQKTPPVTQTPTVFPSISLPYNCTADEQCPTGYACEATQGTGTACPGNSASAPKISCSPTYQIIKGICKLKENERCTTDNDCLSGLICHSVQQGLKTIKICAEQLSGECGGPSGKSCPTGYVCEEGCGPPVARVGNDKQSWICVVKEAAGKPRNCPICLASNTMISTPNGETNVRNITVGTFVWSVDGKGNKIVSKVIKIGNSLVPTNHEVFHLVLSDQRQVWVSPNHSTTTNKTVQDLIIGERYDGARIVSKDLRPYWDTRTYDILPDSVTGFYFANDVPMGSTLK